MKKFFLGFGTAIICMIVAAATFPYRVVQNSSGQIFFTTPIICSNSIYVRTNLVLTDLNNPNGGSDIITVSNGLIVVKTNTTNIGL